MIRNIIFDIGNVLAGFDWRDYLAGYHLSEQQTQTVAEHLYLSPLWKEVDRGKLDDETILREMCKDVPEDMNRLIRLVYHGTAASVREYRYAPELLEALKEEGYKIYILSNYGKTFYEQRIETFEFLKFADGKVISYEIQSIKPEPLIYRTLLKKYHLKPEECLYFDDIKENLDGAENFGIHTCLVTGYDSIINGLENYGISI